MNYPQTLYVKRIQDTHDREDDFWLASEFPMNGAIQYERNAIMLSPTTVKVLKSKDETIASQVAEIQRLRELLRQVVIISRPPTFGRHGISSFLPDEFIDQILAEINMELPMRENPAQKEK